MSKLQEQYCSTTDTPLDDGWILNQLSQSGFDSSSVYSGTTAGMGSFQIDFTSEIFDNSNVGPSPQHHFNNSRYKFNNTSGPVQEFVANDKNCLSTAVNSNPFKARTEESLSSTPITLVLNTDSLKKSSNESSLISAGT